MGLGDQGSNLICTLTTLQFLFSLRSQHNRTELEKPKILRQAFRKLGDVNLAEEVVGMAQQHTVSGENI